MFKDVDSICTPFMPIDGLLVLPQCSPHSQRTTSVAFKPFLRQAPVDHPAAGHFGHDTSLVMPK